MLYLLIYSFLNLSLNMYVKHFHHEPLARETWAATPRAFDVN